jgi:hypothetical protein
MGIEDCDLKLITIWIRKKYGKGDVFSTHDPQCYTTKDCSPSPISFELTWSNCPAIF